MTCLGPDDFEDIEKASEAFVRFLVVVVLFSMAAGVCLTLLLQWIC